MVVEGEDDKVILTELLASPPGTATDRGDSKQSLKFTAQRIAMHEKVIAGYIRDRDHDYDPPRERDRPVRDPKAGNPLEDGVHGFHWCRHEIENYLVEPSIIAAALPNIERDPFETALRDAAQSIRYYEAARWAVGCRRRGIPAKYDLLTKPESIRKGLKLPHDLSETASRNWALEAAATHWNLVHEAIGEHPIQDAFDFYASTFTDEFCEDVDEVLVWFSGKDLLVGIADWGRKNGFQSPRFSLMR